MAQSRSPVGGVLQRAALTRGAALPSACRVLGGRSRGQDPRAEGKAGGSQEAQRAGQPNATSGRRMRRKGVTPKSRPVVRKFLKRNTPTSTCNDFQRRRQYHWLVMLGRAAAPAQSRSIATKPQTPSARPIPPRTYGVPSSERDGSNTNRPSPVATNAPPTAVRVRPLRGPMRIT